MDGQGIFGWTDSKRRFVLYTCVVASLLASSCLAEDEQGKEKFVELPSLSRQPHEFKG